MTPNSYSEAEKKDIISRVDKANAFLKELQLTPAAVIQKIKMEGDDVFVDKVIPYLQDTRYAMKPPVKINAKDLE